MSFDQDEIPSFKQYIDAKKHKLRDQFHSDIQHIGAIFKGICITVNGWTSPSSQDLRKLIVQYGGKYETYPTSLVTHIVATNLPNSTILRLKPTDKVVKPEWILESIAAQQLLPWGNYRLIDLQQKEGNLSMSISSMFSKSTGGSESSGIRDASLNNKINEEKLEAPEISEESEAEEEGNKKSPVKIKNIILETNPIGQNALSTKLSSIPKANSHQPNKGPLVCTDPNFLASYFENSRLHHLSLWKNKFQEELAKEIQPLIDNNEDSSPDKECTFFHVDMDCFFASVTVRFHPELKDLPIGICHSTNASGTADVAACNYIARKYGVKNGMWIKTAVELCPKLHLADYEFENYEKISRILFKVLLRYCQKIQIISCDEAFLDITGVKDPVALASAVRNDIFAMTGCTASIGIGANRLLARLATKKAKPNGQFYISSSQTSSFLAPLPVGELPSVGRKLQKLLHASSITTVGQLQNYSLEFLQKKFGTKTGETLFKFARGIDEREIAYNQKRKTIGVDCNWGVRMTKNDELLKFLEQLSNELAKRLLLQNLQTNSICLKLRIRSKDAPVDSAKFLGMGITDGYSKSISFPVPCVTGDAIFKYVQQVIKQIAQSVEFVISDIRGIGIHAQKLSEVESNQSKKRGTISQMFLKNQPPAKQQKINEYSTINPTEDTSNRNPVAEQPAVQPPPPGNWGKKNEVPNPLAEQAAVQPPPPATKKKNPPKKQVTKKRSTKPVKKGAPKEIGKIVLPDSISQIDSDVLQELPTPIRKEITFAMEKNTTREKNAKEKPAVEAEPPANQEIELCFDHPCCKFYDWSPAYSQFRTTVDSIESVTDQHVNSLILLLSEMINSLNLEDTQKSLSYLKKKAKEGVKQWEEPYKTVEHCIQTLVQNKYGGTLDCTVNW